MPVYREDHWPGLNRRCEVDVHGCYEVVLLHPHRKWMTRLLCGHCGQTVIKDLCV